MGHVLGLSHPDQGPARNVRLDPAAPLNASSCRRPLRYVNVAPLEATGRDAARAEATLPIMYSLTTERVRACLSADDYEGLHALYPTCDPTDPSGMPGSQPLCIKPRQVAGYLRLIVMVAVPYVLASLALLISQQLVRAHYRQRVRRLAREVDEMRLKFEHTSHRAQELESSVHTLTEDRSRLERDLQRTTQAERLAWADATRARREVAEVARTSCAALAQERALHAATKAEMAQVLRQSTAGEVTSIPASECAATRSLVAAAAGPSSAASVAPISRGRGRKLSEPNARSARQQLSMRLGTRFACLQPGERTRRLLQSGAISQRVQQRERDRARAEDSWDRRMELREVQGGVPSAVAPATAQLESLVHAKGCTSRRMWLSTPRLESWRRGATDSNLDTPPTAHRARARRPVLQAPAAAAAEAQMPAGAAHYACFATIEEDESELAV